MLTIPPFGSTRHTDGDYDPYVARIADRLRIYVDSVPVPAFVAYNQHEGWVRALKWRGRGTTKEYTLVGRVIVRWR